LILTPLLPALVSPLSSQHEQNNRSWRPWLASLAVELASLGLLSRGRAALHAGAWKALPPPGRGGGGALAAGGGGGGGLLGLALLRGLMAQPLCPSEEHAALLRPALLARYLVRSPFFDAATRPALEGVARRLARVPLVGRAATLLTEVAEGMQGYYTYVES
jgi:hypothetical protein